MHHTELRYVFLCSFFQEKGIEVNECIFSVLGIYYELYSLPDFTNINELDLCNFNCDKDGWQYNFNGLQHLKSIIKCKTTFGEFSV